MSFVQDVMAKENGINACSGVGWTFTADDPNHPPTYNNELLPRQPRYTRYLDAEDDALSPIYGATAHPTADPDTIDYRTNDSPQTGTPDVPLGDLEYTESIDVKTSYRMYFVASFTDGSVYAVAHLDWTFNAYGINPIYPLGPTVNKTPAGVEAGAGVISNEDPWTGFPTYTASHRWVANQ